MNKRVWAGLTAGCVLLALPLSVGAQNGMFGRRPAPAMMAQSQQREIDDIALLLNLRPPQRPALEAFVKTMGPPMEPSIMGPMMGDRGQRPPEVAPPSDGFGEQIERMTQDAARRAADDTRRIGAIRTLYDGLDPTQRRAFEALMRLRRGPGPHSPMQRGEGPPPPMGGMPPRP